MPDGHHREGESYILDRSSPVLNILRHSTQQQLQLQQVPSLQPRQQTQQQQQRTIPSDQDIEPRPSHKRQRSSYYSSRFTLPLRPTTDSPLSRSFSELTPSSLANDPNPPNEMSDGKNEARALRVLEIMNDFRTLQVHITSMCTRAEANPPDQASYYLNGYALLRQCNAEAQAILATNYNPGSLGIGPGVRVPDTEVQKATLQRIILDASTRRFQAHKIYLRAAAAMRWIQLRQQIASGNYSPGKKAQALQQIDTRLQTEREGISNESVVNDLRGADRRKNYWLDEDPSLERMLAWIERQR